MSGRLIATALTLLSAGCLPMSVVTGANAGAGPGPSTGVHGGGGIGAALLPGGHESMVVGADVEARETSSGGFGGRGGVRFGYGHFPLPYEPARGYEATVRVYAQDAALDHPKVQVGTTVRLSMPWRISTTNEPWDVEKDSRLRHCDVLIGPYVEFPGGALTLADGTWRFEEPLTLGVVVYVHDWTILAP